MAIKIKKHPGESPPGQMAGKSHQMRSAAETLSSGPASENQLEPPHAKTDPLDWQSRLLRRRYCFPPSRQSEQDWAVRIEHGGKGYFFPLGSSNVKIAAAQADRIHQTALNLGWNAVNQNFSRELIVSFEWCMNPVLWTYTTIHTLVENQAKSQHDLPPAASDRQRILVLEPDAGISRALCWSIDQQPGFVSVPYNSASDFTRALTFQKPRMVLLNRGMAGRIGLKSVGAIAPIQTGLPVLTYSIHADGDQMFVSTPGGAGGYLVKRVKPDRLLEPILKVLNQPAPATGDFLLPVKYYFQELLQLPSSHTNPALVRLTNREREVLELLSKGCVDKEIAQAMGIGVWTVHGHLKKIFEVLNVHSRTEAVIRYFEK